MKHKDYDKLEEEPTEYDHNGKRTHVTLSNGKRMTKKTWIMSGLRRMTYRWPPLNEVEKNSRVERGRYKCATCGELFKAGEYAKDHVVPIVPYEGFPLHPVTGGPDWTIIIERMLTDVEDLQILCHACHDMKTAIEDSMRASYNQKQKDEEKARKKQEKLDKKKKI